MCPEYHLQNRYSCLSKPTYIFCMLVDISAMRTIDLYRSTLVQILDNPEEVGSLVIDADQLEIFNLLHQQGAIALRSLAPTDAKPAIVSSRPLVAYDASYQMLDADGIKKRLGDLEQWVEKNLKFLGNDKEGQATILFRGDGFVHYGNGLITYKDEIVRMPRQSACVFGVLMGSYRHYVSADSISDDAGVRSEGMDASQKSKRASKIVSELNGHLSELIGYDPITSHAGRGWVLEFTQEA